MKKYILMIIMVLGFASFAIAATKEGQIKQGNVLYQKGDYAHSLKHYEEALKKDAESPAINFNLGTAQYKNGQYADAVTSLQKSLLSDDPLLKKNAHFNLGDVYYGLGKQNEKQNVDAAITAMEEALRQFETVMNLDDKDMDARYNYDIVKKELEQLKKNKEQQKNNQQNKQDKNQKQDQNQDSNQQKDQSQSQTSSGKGSDKQNQDQNSKANPEDKKQPDPSQSKQDEKQEGQQKSEDKKEKSSPSSGQDSQNNDSSGHSDQKTSAVQPGEMTKEEAKDLLKQFKQDEEPAGLLNLNKSSGDERPVLKDW